MTIEEYYHQLFTCGQISLSDYLSNFGDYKIYTDNMVVTELGDCTVVIGKEDNDRSGFTIGSMFEDRESPRVDIFILNEEFTLYRVKEYIFNDEVLIAYFDSIPEEIKVGTQVGVKVGKSFYVTFYDRTVDACYIG